MTGRAATWVRPGQVQRLRTACYDEQFRPRLGQRNEAVVAVLYDAGLRVGELVRLDVDDFDLERATLRRPTGERSEGRRDRSSCENSIALDPAHSLGTVRLLTSYLYNRDVETTVAFSSREGDRLTPKAVRDVVTKTAELAAVRPYTPAGRGEACDVSPQTLRHGTAWRLLNTEDRTIATVQERLGHTARSTTRSLYAQFEPGASDDPAVDPWNAVADHLEESDGVTSVLESVPDVLYVFDTNGRMRWWNSQVSTVTGYSDAEIATMHPLEFVLNDDTPALAEAIARVVERGTVETEESYLVTKDGTPIPYEFNGAPLTDEAGDVWGLVGMGRDISARRRAARTAERERERFELFVDAVTDYAMFLLDPDGRIASWNEGAERIKGYREAEVVGEHFSLLHPDDAVADGVPERLLEEAATEGRTQDEGWRVREDGSTFWAHVTITALYDEGELQGFAKVTRDVTERRAHEREIARQRDELERLNRINTVVRDIDRVLVRAASRAEIERAVCDRLTTVDPYVAAWIDEPRTKEARSPPRAWAGCDVDDADAFLDAVVDATSTRLSRRVAHTRETHVSHSHSRESSDVDRDRPARLECATTVAIPIRYRETLYGVLVVAVDGSTPVGERQQAVLTELGETVGYAIAAAERKEALVTDSAVELALDVRNPDQFFVRTAARLEADVRLEGIAKRGEASYLEYFTVDGASPAAVLGLANGLERLDHVRVIRYRNGACLCEVGVADASILTTVAEFGGTLTEMTAESGRGSGTVRVELPRSAEVGRVLDAVETAVAGVELQAKRTVDRPLRTENRFRSAFDDSLTEKQREAVEAAYLAGFFELPRLSTGEEVADSLGISPSTFHQHVRVGLQKLLSTVAETAADDRA